MSSKNLKVQLFSDRRGNWRWRVRARNGKLVATAGECFASKSNARRAWKAFRKGVEAMT
jgi:uncharacterized protein YegP (UPF0339 family)